MQGLPRRHLRRRHQLPALTAILRDPGKTCTAGYVHLVGSAHDVSTIEGSGGLTICTRPSS
jgi:hypothetical protein